MIRSVEALVTRRARIVLALSVALVVLAGLLGSGAVGRLKGGGFDDPASESSRAKVALQQTFGQQEANLVLLVSTTGGARVDDPGVASQARAAVSRLRSEPGVSVLGDYWDAAGPSAAGLRSTDGARALVVAHIAGDDDAVRTRMERLSTEFTITGPHTRIETGGFGQASLDINGQVTQDLATAESLAIPLTLALLVLVFGSVVAGLLPLLVGGIAITGTFATLWALAAITDVSIFALNLTTALGLGLAVDYSLLIVSRFREELALGRAPAEAIGSTLHTAGRTVLFSSATIAVALAALLVFPLYFLRSFAYAGIAVVAVAALAALITLPALLGLLGPRVERLRVRPRRSALATGSGFWSRLASFVMRRPALAAVPVVAVLLGLGAPFLSASFGLPDDRVIPAGSSQARRVGDVLRADFTSQDSGALTVVLPALPGVGGAQRRAEVAGYAATLSRLPDAARVDSAAGIFAAGRLVGPAAPGTTAGEASYLRVVPAVDAYSARAEALVRDVRATPSPGTRLVGGPAAELVDVKAGIGDRLPLAIGLIALTTFVLLFLFTGSVVLPVKALVINAVTIAAVLGSMVWVFQEGHLSGLFGFTPQPLAITMPLLMFCVAFGLSMDYEVFLLGRIKEEHDRGADTTAAVATGLERTGRITTTAAALLAITFFAFTTSKVSFLQMFGLGTGLAIVLDATLVRGALVPALMRVMGPVNWWAPRPLRRLHAAVGLSEGAGARPTPVPASQRRPATEISPAMD